jgi:hypothetical protein
MHSQASDAEWLQDRQTRPIVIPPEPGLHDIGHVGSLVTRQRVFDRRDDEGKCEHSEAVKAGRKPAPIGAPGNSITDDTDDECTHIPGASELGNRRRDQDRDGDKQRDRGGRG